MLIVGCSSTIEMTCSWPVSFRKGTHILSEQLTLQNLPGCGTPRFNPGLHGPRPSSFEGIHRSKSAFVDEAYRPTTRERDENFDT